MNYNILIKFCTSPKQVLQVLLQQNVGTVPDKWRIVVSQVKQLEFYPPLKNFVNKI